MRRLLPILLLLCAAPAWASGIAVVTHCTAAAATSCTLAATPSFGNLMIAMAYNSSSATAPTTATGYTVIKSETGNTNALKLGWKFSTGTETTCGTWTTATQTFCEVYSGAWITSSGGVATSTPSGATAATSSTTLSYGTFTLQNYNSWVVCAGGAGSSTAGADAAPTGMTLRSGTGIVTIAYSDTNGTVTTWSTQTVTYTTASHNATACFEIAGTPAVSGIGSLIVDKVYTGSSGEACTSTCIFTIPYHPPGTLTNNLLTVFIEWTYASTLPTVSSIYCNSDTGHSTWTFTAGPSESDTGDLTYLASYYIAGATAGCNTVNVQFATALPTSLSGSIEQWQGIATSSPLDTSGSNETTTDTGYWTPGSITTGTSGDLIVNHCAQESFGTVGETFVYGFFPGGTTQINSDYAFPLYTWAFVQTTAGAISPYMATTNAQHSLCVAMAFKASSGAGTAPTGTYVISQQNGFSNTASPVFQTDVQVAGDALVFMMECTQTGNTAQWSTFTDLLGSSGTSYQTKNASGGYPNWWVACNATAGQDVFTLTGAPSGACNSVIIEIAGQKSSGCVDATAGMAVAQANTGSGGAYANMPSITPSTASGVILASIIEGVGPTTTVTTPSCAIYSYPSYTGQTDASQMNEGGGFSVCLNTGTTVQNYGWTAPNANTTSANASAIALESPASAETNPPHAGIF